MYKTGLHLTPVSFQSIYTVIWSAKRYKTGLHLVPMSILC